MKKLLIIGGVAAGATAAARARRLNKDIKITMLEAGPDVSFANCGLPYYIGGDIKSRSKLILQSPESFKDQYDVDVHTMTEAMEIDRDAKIVKAIKHQTGETVSYEYDKLILSQGGKPFIPGMEGTDNDNVFSLWTLEDMDRIDDHIKNENPQSAVVVGGGFIGLEMVEALKKRGLTVHNVELAPHIMPMMEAEIAGYLQEELDAYRVSLHTGRSVTAIKDRSVVLDDGSELDADMVLLSVGVRPTLTLAKQAGLELGESGGLLVDEYLQTSDKDILAGGDMAETIHRVLGKKVRIPLAGPANRQGRIAASNALASSEEEKMAYKGAQGTSIVRVFEAVAGTTGLNLKQALNAGLDAQAIVIRKENHVSYYPGGRMLSIHLIYDVKSGRILGAQTAGYNGADKRLDVLSTAIAAGMTIEDLAELDLAYAPPFGSANDPVNMAGFVAQNRQSGYSPAITAAEAEDFIRDKELALVDIRDYFSYQKGTVKGAANLAPEKLLDALAAVSKDTAILLFDDSGKIAHRTVRQLLLNGYSEARYISGGYPSLEYYARGAGFEFLQLPLQTPEEKNLTEELSSPVADKSIEENTSSIDTSGPIVIDVRSPEEFAMGTPPGAVNIPLDELQSRMKELGALDRDITLFCTSGARSGYGQRVLVQQGFTNVKNGGSLGQMMAG
ncbi:MAG: CoA-disulfide reductase [Spirochaetaceae bacterium 4572_59]|nr:MAG: CoA-disulfide reductase [Spirochaetaceae bacterium 4572_59]